ncbi:hypothetical protein Tco_1326592 [Tanacetum coccineum]
MAMTTDENSDSESDTEDPPLKKSPSILVIRSKPLMNNLLTDLELKPLPDNLNMYSWKKPSFLPVIISSQLSKEKKNKLIYVLKKHKQAFAWKTTDIPGICPSFCKPQYHIWMIKTRCPKLEKVKSKPVQEVVKKNRETPGYRIPVLVQKVGFYFLKEFDKVKQKIEKEHKNVQAVHIHPESENMKQAMERRSRRITFLEKLL